VKVVLRVRAIPFAFTLILCSCTALPVSRQAQTLPPAATPALKEAMPSESGQPREIGPTERWIEVDLAQQKIRLHNAGHVVVELPAATGAAVDLESTTPLGLYRVQSKEKGPVESAPGVYCSDVLMIDIVHGMGIHSMPMDKDGRILDSRLGQPITAGCVRVGESAVVFDFAQLGTKVWIH
jgi:hypothetical protein